MPGSSSHAKGSRLRRRWPGEEAARSGPGRGHGVQARAIDREGRMISVRWLPQAGGQLTLSSSYAAVRRLLAKERTLRRFWKPELQMTPFVYGSGTPVS